MSCCNKTCTCKTIPVVKVCCQKSNIATTDTCSCDASCNCSINGASGENPSVVYVVNPPDPVPVVPADGSCPDERERISNTAIYSGDPCEISFNPGSPQADGFIWNSSLITEMTFAVINTLNSGQPRIDGLLWDGNAYGFEGLGEANGQKFGPVTFSGTIGGQTVTVEVTNASNDVSFINSVAANAPGTQSMQIANAIPFPLFRVTWAVPVSQVGIVISNWQLNLERIGDFNFVGAS